LEIIDKGAIIMNIGQIARNQQMLYNIANKNISSGASSKPEELSSAKLSAYSGLLNGLGLGSVAEKDGDNFFSSPAALQGTVRQIARRLHDASFSSDSIAEESGASITQGSSAAGADQALQAIRKQLGAKVESQQQIYQPDRASLSGNFAQLQALAESYASRLQTVSLSDETTKKIQEMALMDAKNSAGKNGGVDMTNTSVSSRDRLSTIQEEVQKYAPSKRAAALNTINKVWESELDRIGSYIKEKDPNWTIWGDQFDVSILDDYKAGVNVWV